jgi:hypothetical protein
MASGPERGLEGVEGEPEELPDLLQLHLRHPGLTPGVCESFAEAARVCLDRHHESPVDLEMYDGDSSCRYRLNWMKSTERIRGAFNNKDEATRDGAYLISISAIEASEGLVAVKRAENRTGADYYLDHRPFADDFELSYRLEISGVDAGTRAAVKQRLTEKVEQALAGDSDLPAYAAVVGFKELVVMYAPIV